MKLLPGTKSTTLELFSASMAWKDYGDMGSVCLNRKYVQLRKVAGSDHGVQEI